MNVQGKRALSREYGYAQSNQDTFKKGRHFGPPDLPVGGQKMGGLATPATRYPAYIDSAASMMNILGGPSQLHNPGSMSVEHNGADEAGHMVVTLPGPLFNFEGKQHTHTHLLKDMLMFHVSAKFDQEKNPCKAPRSCIMSLIDLQIAFQPVTQMRQKFANDGENYSAKAMKPPFSSIVGSLGVDYIGVKSTSEKNANPHATVVSVGGYILETLDVWSTVSNQVVNGELLFIRASRRYGLEPFVVTPTSNGMVVRRDIYDLPEDGQKSDELDAYKIMYIGKVAYANPKRNDEHLAPNAERRIPKQLSEARKYRRISISIGSRGDPVGVDFSKL